jgi:hypothetical protein
VTDKSPHPVPKGNTISKKKPGLPSSVHEDVTHWFFDHYLPTWVGVCAGTIARGPEFILDYWGVPQHYSTDLRGEWLLDASAVVRLLEETHARLQANG